MGQRAAAIAAEWGPDRFARGTLEALRIAECHEAMKQHRPCRAVG
jgi:hypothetical protein